MVLVRDMSSLLNKNSMSAHTACVPIDTSAKTLNVMGTASQNPVLKREKKGTNVLLKCWKHLPQES